MSSEHEKTFYSEYRSWKGWAPEVFGALDPRTRVYLERELPLCGVPDLNGREVLEIGFGNGSFAVWATENGARYRGTEQIPELLEAATRHGLEVQTSSEPLDRFVEPDSLDLVVSFDVFEHIEREELRSLLRSLALALKPSARLIARVPSGDSPFSRAIQHGDLTHRMVLGSSAIHQLVEGTGLEVVQIREPAYPVRGLGLRAFVRRGAVRILRSLLYPLMTHALMGGGSPVLEPNLVFVLKRSPREAAGAESAR